jgi:hypothetical protein
MPSGLVRIELRRPFADGTVAVEMDPLSLLCRLAAMVPTPRMHTVRYGGVLAPASKWRPLVVPAPPPAQGGDGLATDLPAAATTTATTAADGLAHPTATRSSALTTQAPQAPHPRDLADSAVATSSCGSVPGSPCSTTERKPTHRCRWRPWAQLLARTFREELGNCRCGGRMKLRAIVTRPKSVRRILQRLGEPTDPPARAPARSPPFFQTRPLRRRLRPASAQMPMFEG